MSIEGGKNTGAEMIWSI